MKKMIWCLVAVCMFIPATHVWADTVDYEVKAVHSDRQVNQQVGYFDLKLEKNEHTQLLVEVTNCSKQPIDIQTNVDKATTNAHGVVEYKNSVLNQTIDLPKEITTIIRPEKRKVHLEPAEKTVVHYTVNMPSTTFAGEIVGGISFIQEKTKENTTTSSMAVTNQYGYIIAVVLHGHKAVTSNHVTVGKIVAGQENGRNQIQVPIENHSPAFLNQVATTVAIRRKGQEKILYQRKKEGDQIAPNTIYQYAVSTDEQALSSGTYEAKIHVASKKQQWDFTKEFMISSKKTAQLNRTAVIKKARMPIEVVVILVLGTLAVIFLCLLILFTRRKNKEIHMLRKEMGQYEKKKTGNQPPKK